MKNCDLFELFWCAIDTAPSWCCVRPTQSAMRTKQQKKSSSSSVLLTQSNTSSTLNTKL